MALNLHSLRPAKGATHKRKRVGRGNASGHGSYATKGIKGQKSRSGVTNLKRLGLKKMLLSVPKTRGFKSLNPKNQAVNLSDLNRVFEDGAIVNSTTLFAAGLIGNTKNQVKILGKGELKIKDLVFENVLMSESAANAIKANGGKIK